VIPDHYISLPPNQWFRRWLARWVPQRLANAWWSGPTCPRCGASYGWKLTRPLAIGTVGTITPLCAECEDELAWADRRKWVEELLVELLGTRKVWWLCCLYDVDMTMRMLDLEHGDVGTELRQSRPE